MSFADLTHEFFRCHLCLTQKTGKCPDLDLVVHRHDATFGAALHDNVAATLSSFLKSEAFKRTLNFGAREMRQLRHVPVQEP